MLDSRRVFLFAAAAILFYRLIVPPGMGLAAYPALWLNSLSKGAKGPTGDARGAPQTKKSASQRELAG
jgi:hypothetical protein